MSKVQLYVYDLSNGLARSLSLPLTGKQIDGIWHTSVVVYGREIFYGQGVMETPPGRSHHGQPLQIIDYETTEIPEEIFNEYLEEMKEEYTMMKYHLLTFNCNSFTQDVVGFLTGQKIPEWISNLPQEFLSTPFGQQFKPQIDAMYTRQPISANGNGYGGYTNGHGNQNGLAGGLLAGVAAQARGPVNGNATSSGSQPNGTSGVIGNANNVNGNINGDLSSSLSSPLTIITNPASLSSSLTTHPTSIALITRKSIRNTTKSLEREFEELARDLSAQSGGGMGFLVVDREVGKGEEVVKGLNLGGAEREGEVVVLYKGGKVTQKATPADSEELEALAYWHLAESQ